MHLEVTHLVIHFSCSSWRYLNKSKHETFFILFHESHIRKCHKLLYVSDVGPLVTVCLPVLIPMLKAEIFTSNNDNYLFPKLMIDKIHITGRIHSLNEWQRTKEHLLSINSYARAIHNKFKMQKHIHTPIQSIGGRGQSDDDNNN